jgi:hypothetical protein
LVFFIFILAFLIPRRKGLQIEILLKDGKTIRIKLLNYKHSDVLYSDIMCRLRKIS